MSKDLLARYYKKKEKIFKKSYERYQNLRKKNKKWEYGRERYKNVSETQKQRLVENRKRYCQMRKKIIINI